MPDTTEHSASVTSEMLRAEIARLNKMVQALMNRAERSTSARGSDFSLFQTAVTLEDQVRRRTADLEAALRENEKITRALQHAKEQMERDLAERRRAEALRDGQRRVLEKIARDVPLPESLAELLQVVESQSEGVLASIMLLAEDGLHVKTVISPSLPPDYGASLVGLEAAEGVGSCGTAMYRKAPIIVTDILTDPLWKDFRALASPHGLRACWSTPIFSGGGEVLGAFAMYYKEVREPSDAEWKLTELAVGIAGIAIERELNEAYVRHIAHHDALTGLPNRLLLEDRLQQAIAQAHRHDRMVAVLFLDLDHFKHINDSLGHHVGDCLLQAVAQRMEACLREGDSVARLGGDEFIISLCDISRNQDAASVAWKIQQSLSEPVQVEGRTLQVGASIGISLYPIDGTDVKTLMRAADAAMYDAKAKGRANYQFFTPELNIVAHRRLIEATQLRQALAREEFVVHYQPQLHVGSGAIVGAEALVRWQHPEHGMLPPARFIATLEELGLMTDVGTWVLRTACMQCVEWQRAGLPPIRMAVNLSARQFSSGDIVRTVAEVLLESGLDPQWLELELTESLILDNSERVITAMRDLKSMGVRLSLDDFGTGYSSLSYLRRFPVDRLKIDRSFIRDITTDAGCADIVRSILALSQKLGIAVIAEGVENEAQLGYLQRQGCAEVQGYLYSRPVPASDMTELLRTDRRLPVLDAAVADARTLLVVDGDEYAAAMMQRVLRAEGMRVIAAPTAEQALELLAMHHVQVIVADLHLSDCSGIDFLGLAKKLYPDAIRVLATKTAEVASVVSAINHGAIYKLLVKPLDSQALVENISDAFNLYFALQEKSGSREKPSPGRTDMQATGARKENP